MKRGLFLAALVILQGLIWVATIFLIFGSVDARWKGYYLWDGIMMILPAILIYWDARRLKKRGIDVWDPAAWAAFTFILSWPTIAIYLTHRKFQYKTGSNVIH